MSNTLHIDEIVERSQEEFNRLTILCNQIPDDRFFHQAHADKWSIAQHLQHLIISTRTTTAAYALPKFLVRLIGGRPNRPSHSYEELVDKYKMKLQRGGKANGRYIPKEIKAGNGKEEILFRWKKTTTHYLKSIKDNWSDERLDKYIVMHPLLGKITLRELCYFTIYHTYHHHTNIKNL